MLKQPFIADRYQSYYPKPKTQNHPKTPKRFRVQGLDGISTINLQKFDSRTHLKVVERQSKNVMNGCFRSFFKEYVFKNMIEHVHGV